MRERLLDYIAYEDRITSEPLTSETKDVILKDLLIQIKFFQHERLIHLIVTVIFALIAILSTIANYMMQNIFLLIFTLGMYVMLLFYVRHYFLLERGVQKLYTFYDRLIH